MLEYKIRKFELKYYIFGKLLFMCKTNFTIMCICFPSMLFFLIVGYCADREALMYGYPLLFIFCFFFLITLIYYFTLKRNTKKHFDKVSENGVVNYSIDLHDDIYKLICVNNKDCFKFRKSNIKYIKKYKKVIILKLDTSAVITVPNKNEIYELFKIN